MTDQVLTYDGADVAEFLYLANPPALGMHRIISGLRQASAGVPAARILAYRFVQHWIDKCYAGEIVDVAEYVDEIWDGNAPAEDLRTLASEMAGHYEALAFDSDLSDMHPEPRDLLVKQYTECAADLKAWADRPRVDMLSALEKAAPKSREGKPWPHLISYEKKQAAKHARLFVRTRPWKTLSSDDVLYSFTDDGFWCETSDSEMQAEVRATDPEDQLDVDQVAKLVKGVHHLTNTKAKPFDWIVPHHDDPPAENLALFRNGLLDVREGRLIQNDGRYFATGLPEHDWDPLAECPTWKKWLDETLHPSFHDTLQEWFGYCLTPDVRAHKFAVFTGPPRSGKSTAHSVLDALVGSQHSAPITLPDLAGDFGLQNMLDKRLTVIPDAHDAPASRRGAALERLKSITGGDALSVNRKNKSIVTAQLKTRLVVTCNRVPNFIDESGALAARMLIIAFEKSFLGNEDRTLGDRLKAEMSGIANWALVGLARLRSNEYRFTVGEEGLARVQMVARSQSPALRFAEACLELTGDEEDHVPMREVYRAYEAWTSSEGMHGGEHRSQNHLKDDLLAALAGRIQYKQRRVDKKPTYVLTGVKSAELVEFNDD